MYAQQLLEDAIEGELEGQGDFFFCIVEKVSTSANILVAGMSFGSLFAKWQLLQ
jgi:hypothetical protein